MTEIIEETRTAGENEFFFDHHSNIGVCEEFERLIKYINQHSNIRIEKVNYESIEQIQSSKNYSGGSYNLRVIKDE